MSAIVEVPTQFTPVASEVTAIVAELGLIPPQLLLVFSHFGPVLAQFPKVLPDRLSVSFAEVFAELVPVVGQFPTILPDLPVILAELAQVLADLAAVTPDLLGSHRGDQEERGGPYGEGEESLRPQHSRNGELARDHFHLLFRASGPLDPDSPGALNQWPPPCSQGGWPCKSVADSVSEAG